MIAYLRQTGHRLSSPDDDDFLSGDYRIRKPADVPTSFLYVYLAHVNTFEYWFAESQNEISRETYTFLAYASILNPNV